MANPKSAESKVKIFRENINWKNLFLASAALVIAIMAIGYLNNGPAFQLGQPRLPTSCQDLPDNFEQQELPRAIACWCLKMRPDRFSGRIILPENVKFRLSWRTTGLVQIRNANGEVLTIDPRVKNDLGVNEGNLVLQFKGQGTVLIIIERCSN
jgi:hypothetical protein